MSITSGTECKKALEGYGFQKVDLLDIAEPAFAEKLARGGYDVAFPALHGRYGEDGCIQGMLEVMHIPYAFSGVYASAVATQKEAAKVLFEKAGLRVPRGVDLAPATKLTQEQKDALVDELGLPLFVKPSGNGSSFGITRVTEKSQLQGAVDLAWRHEQRVLVEEVRPRAPRSRCLLSATTTPMPCPS